MELGQGRCEERGYYIPELDGHIQRSQRGSHSTEPNGNRAFTRKCGAITGIGSGGRRAFTLQRSFTDQRACSCQCTFIG